MSNRFELSDNFIKSYPKPEKEIEIYDSKIKNLAIRIYKTGSKSFVYRYYFNETSKRFTIGKFPNFSTEQARIKAQQIYQKVQDGIDPLRERKRKQRESDSTTFKKAVDQFLEEDASTNSESTYDLYSRVLKRQFKKLHPIYLSELKRKQVMNICRAKVRQGHRPMAEHMRKISSRFLNWCKSVGIVEDNCMTGTESLSDTEKRERYYDFQEIIELWNYMDTFPEPYKSFYKILFMTGQRKTETRLMKWEHLDGDNALWTIPSELTKNNNQQKVPLTKQALKVLQNLKKNHSKKSEFVFKSTRSNKPFKGVDYYSKKIKENTSVSDFRNHDIRRTVATQMAELGVIPFVVGRILNHKKMAEDDDITAQYNRGEYLDEQEQALKKWNNHLEKIIKVDLIKKLEAELGDNSENKIAKLIIDSELVEHNFKKEKEENKPKYSDLDLDF